MDRDTTFAALQRELRPMIAEAARASFTHVRAQLPNDHFYLFALSTTIYYAGMAPSFATEEGLQQVAAEYATKDYKKGKSLEEIENDLRWSLGDSPYLDIAQEPFYEVNGRLYEFAHYANEDENEDWYWDVFVGFVRETMFAALEDLEREGFFGRGPERDKLVVNILTNDQTDLEVRTGAERLNPRSALTRLYADLTILEPDKYIKYIGSSPVSMMYAIASAPKAGIIAASGNSYAAAWRYDGRCLVDMVFDLEVSWSVAISPDGDELVVAEEERIRRFSLKDGSEHDPIQWTDDTLSYTERRRNKISTVAISPDKKLLAVGDHSPKITLLELATGSVRWTVDQLATSLGFTHSGERLVAGGSGAWVFETRTGAALAEMATEPRNNVNLHTIGCSTNQTDVVTVSRGLPVRVQLWSGLTLKQEFVLPEDQTPGESGHVALSPDGSLFATAHGTGAIGGQVCVWSSETGALLMTRHGRWEFLCDVVFMDDRRVAVVGSDPDRSPPIGYWEIPAAGRNGKPFWKKLFARSQATVQ